MNHGLLLATPHKGAFKVIKKCCRKGEHWCSAMIKVIQEGCYYELTIKSSRQVAGYVSLASRTEKFSKKNIVVKQCTLFYLYL